MTGEVEVVAKMNHYATHAGCSRALNEACAAAASALEALRADKERLEKERDEARGLVAEYRDHSQPYWEDRAERAEASLAGRDAEIAKAVAEERDACAKAVESLQKSMSCFVTVEDCQRHNQLLWSAMSAIRARGATTRKDDRRG